MAPVGHPSGPSGWRPDRTLPGVSITVDASPVTPGRVPRARVLAAGAVVVAALTGCAGYLVGVAHEPSRATPRVLTGTVFWSNEQTRLIAFDTDGVVRRPNDGDTVYDV